MTVSRPPAVASRRVRVRRRAAAFSRVAGLAGAGDGARGGAAGEDLAGGAVGVDAGGVLGVAFGLPAGREGRRRGEVRLDGGGDRVDGLADGVQQVGEADLDGGGRGGVGVDAEDAAPAAGEADHGAGVVVGDLVGFLPGGFQPLEGIGADRLLDLGGDVGGLGGLQDAGVAAGQEQGGGRAGLAGGAGFGAGGGEVLQDELADGGAQPAAVAGAAGDLGGLHAGFFQQVGGLAPVGLLGGRGADLAVGGVAAFVGQGAPQDRVAFAVGRAGGVGGGGADAEQACRRPR